MSAFGEPAKHIQRITDCDIKRLADDFTSNVRFGSKADIATGQCHVRFTPKSGHGLSLS